MIKILIKSKENPNSPTIRTLIDCENKICKNIWVHYAMHTYKNYNDFAKYWEVIKIIDFINPNNFLLRNLQDDIGKRKRDMRNKKNK